MFVAIKKELLTQNQDHICSVITWKFCLVSHGWWAPCQLQPSLTFPSSAVPLFLSLSTVWWKSGWRESWVWWFTEKNILTRLLLGLNSSKKCGKRLSHLNVISGDVNPIESRINSMKSDPVLLDSFYVFENYCKLYFVSVQSWSWKINYAIDTNSLVFLTIL